MSTNENGEVDLVALVRALWDLKLVIVLVATVCVAAALYMALTATHIFRADVVVSRVTDTNMSRAASFANQFGSLGRLAGINVGQSGPGTEAQAILESRRLTEEFIERFGVLEEMGGGDDLSKWQAVKDFRELYLSVAENELDGITTVSIEWTDGAKAAEWANGYVALANELVRQRALTQAESNIEYLNKQVDETNVVELQRVIYNLLETEIQTLMLANAREEYAFTVVDPAVAPEKRVRPRRTLMVVSGGAVGVFLGFLVAILINFVRQVRSTSPVSDA